MNTTLAFDNLREVTPTGQPVRQVNAPYLLSEDLLADFLTVICESSPDTVCWATARRVKRNADGNVVQIDLAYDTENDADCADAVAQLAASGDYGDFDLLQWGTK